jgi:hypothetical protein
MYDNEPVLVLVPCGRSRKGDYTKKKTGVSDGVIKYYMVVNGPRGLQCNFHLSRCDSDDDGSKIWQIVENSILGINVN